jgi:anti-anti-sigma factor
VWGEVDMHTAPELWRSASSALELGGRLVIDLRDVSFMDSQGVNVLARAAQEVGDGARLTVRGARPPIRRVLEITGLHRIVVLADE